MGGTIRSSISIPYLPTAQAYSQLILEQLERANMFVVPLDDERAVVSLPSSVCRCAAAAAHERLVGCRGRAPARPRQYVV